MVESVPLTLQVKVKYLHLVLDGGHHDVILPCHMGLTCQSFLISLVIASEVNMGCMYEG